MATHPEKEQSLEEILLMHDLEEVFTDNANIIGIAPGKEDPHDKYHYPTLLTLVGRLENVAPPEIAEPRINIRRVLKDGEDEASFDIIFDESKEGRRTRSGDRIFLPQPDYSHIPNVEPVPDMLQEELEFLRDAVRRAEWDGELSKQLAEDINAGKI